MNEDRRPLAAFLVCSLIWGSTFLVISIGNDSLPAIWSLALRLGIASAILAAIILIRRIEWPKGDGLKAALIFGILEYGLSMPLLYVAEKTISSGLAALVYATCPIASMFFGRIFKTESLNRAKVFAGVAALVGLAVIFSGEMARGGSVIGMLCALTAAVTAVLGNIALVKGPKQSAFGSTAIASLLGFVVCLPLSLAMGEKWVVPSIPAAASVLYLAVFGSVIAFSLAVWLLNHWDASSVAFLGVICPVIAVVLGAVVRHEPITPLTVGGGAIVIASVLVAIRVEAKKAQT